MIGKLIFYIKLYFMIYYIFLIILLILFIFYKNSITFIKIKNRYPMYIIKDRFTINKSILISKLVNNLHLLKNHLYKNKYMYYQYTQYIDLLYKNFNKDTIIEETILNSKNTSFTINKGEKISFCITSKKTGALHDLNILTFVGIHELAHIACPEVGHTNLFYKILKHFIKCSIKIGIYKHGDYSKRPKEYCGLIVNND